MGPRTSGNGRLRESGDNSISGMTHTEESPSSSNTQTLPDDMEVETEPNVYDQYDEYVKQVEVKESDDICAGG
jgi:hypothetical protein